MFRVAGVYCRLSFPTTKHKSFFPAFLLGLGNGYNGCAGDPFPAKARGRFPDA